MKKSIILLGSTGSVGLQAADVARAQNYDVRALCANNNFIKVEEQIREFGVKAAAMTDIAAAAELKLRTRDLPVRIYSGHDGICQMIHDTEADIAVNSIIGTAGLKPTMAVIESGKNLALANKESLVIAGEIVMSKAKEKGVSITPVDSEHCAIAQCLRSGKVSEVKKLIVTASGGPFFGKKRNELINITREQALAHPTWKMGAKITIDSATLMNKGFEVIEASHLFGIPGDNIDVLVHRESIIHSMVEFCDNSVIAQLSVPDMRLCVQYAIEAPDRYQAVIPPLNLAKLGTLTFANPDADTFIPLKLARESLAAGGASSAILHSANEVAVAKFLDGKIGFTDIFDTIEYVCGSLNGSKVKMDLDSVLCAVNDAASLANEFVSRK
jgi:1-deoxy-D-xylulose-5-phosphate reductoisomerase